MTASLLVALVTAAVLRPPMPRFVDKAAVVTRYAHDCKGGAGGPPCKSLGDDLDRAFLVDLERLARAGEPVSPALLRVAIARPNPMLQARAWALLARDGLGAADDPLVAAALESPYLGVRRAAAAAAEVLHGSSLSKVESREYARVFGHRDDASLLFDRDLPPPAARLSLPLYPGATYYPLASGPRSAFFVTSDPAGKVVAAMRGGKAVLSADEIRRVQQEAQSKPDPMLMMRMMQSGQDPRQAAAEMQKAAEAVSSSDWARFDRAPGVEDPRYIVAGEGTLMGKKVPTEIVAVFRDTLLGKTVIFYPLREQHPVNAVGQDFATYVQIQSRLASRPPASGVDPEEPEGDAADAATPASPEKSGDEPQRAQRTQTSH